MVGEPLRKANSSRARFNLPEAQSAIVPVIVGETEAALKASELLRDEGFLVVAIRPPTVAGRHPRGCVSPSPRCTPTPYLISDAARPT